MGVLIGIGLLAACCGVPLLVLRAASLFKRKPVEGREASENLVNNRFRASTLPNPKPEARQEENDCAGRNA